MAIRNLFSIILKVIGILAIKDIVVGLAQFLSFLFTWNNREISWMVILVAMLPVGVYYIIFHLLVFKTDMVIDKLKLNKGFGNEFSFFKEGVLENIPFKPLLTLAVLITSMCLFITELPNFFRLLCIAYEKKHDYREGGEQSTGSYIALSIAKIVIAYILLNACEPVVNFIDRKRSKAEEQQ